MVPSLLLKTVSPELPVYYLDSSLIIKRYLKESGTAQVKQLLGSSMQWYTAALSYAEVLCAFKRAYKTHVISEKMFYAVSHTFQADWAKVDTLEFSPEAQALVSDILKRVYLRGADTVQLSTALCLKNQGLPLIFGTADKQLHIAAKLLRLETWNLK